MQWKEAQETGTYKSAPTDTGGPAIEQVATISSLMAFDGAAPELINGRLAMVGFLAALGAELSSGEGVIMQLNDAPGPVLVTFTLIAAATFVPLLQGQNPDAQKAGPFTAAAEMLNGRAAYAPPCPLPPHLPIQGPWYRFGRELMHVYLGNCSCTKCLSCGCGVAAPCCFCKLSGVHACCCNSAQLLTGELQSA